MFGCRVRRSLILFTWFVLGPVGFVFGHEHQPADPRAIGAIMVRISDDGESLACSYQGALWRISRATGEMTPLTRTGREFDIEPAWSHDGKQVAFIRSLNFRAGRLSLLDVASGNLIPLAKNITASGRIYFDRDNRRLLGLFAEENERPKLAWYEIASGKLEVAAPAEHWNPYPVDLIQNRQLVFAPNHALDAVAVVLTADVPGEQTGNQGPQCEVWRISLTGKPATKIAAWPARIHELCWNADDRALVVATERGGVHHDLWEMPLDERPPRKLTFGQADESGPQVSADGRWLSYTDNRHGATQVVVRDLGTQRDTIVDPKINFGVPTGKLSLQVVERDNETTARVTIRHVDGKTHAPPGALYRLTGEDLHFYLHDHVAIELPAGKYMATAVRGPETETARETFEIKPGATTPVALKIVRWTNQRAAGWVSGESHIHANYGYGHWYNSPATMRLQCEGEDLTIANLMVANSDGNGVFDREFFLGRPDPHSSDETILYWNEEFRATIWGHMTLLNLKHLVEPIYTGFKNTSQPYDVPINAEVADHVHDQDGHVNYTHPAHSQQDPYGGAYTAKEMPIDVALGKVDSMDIMSNQNANMAVWYRMLNCGLRLPAAAGTDCFLNRIPSTLPGAVRVYVHCPDKVNYATWIENLRLGKTFVTNEPMLRFDVENHGPGGNIEFDAPRAVRVAAEVATRANLTKIELVVNGNPRPLAIPPDAKGNAKITESLDLRESCWIALRATTNSGGFAHSGPIYVTIGGEKLRSPDDARFFIEWIDRLREDVRKRNQIPPSRRGAVEEQLQKGADFYRAQLSPK